MASSVNQFTAISDTKIIIILKVTNKVAQPFTEL